MALWQFPAIFITFILARVDAIPVGQFYPFGPLNGDNVMESGDDISTNELDLGETIVFFNTSFRTIYVNVNGHVSFDSEVPDYRGDLSIPFGLHLIAVFLADVDTTAAGRVYYRSTTDVQLIHRAALDIRTNFTGFESFIPTLLFIVTWDNVGYYQRRSDKLNTFQLVLASNGKDSFAFFHYLDHGIQWMRSEGKFMPTYDDIPPQAGFDGGDGGPYYKLPGSGETGAFVSGSNVNVPGVWIHHIGNTGTGNIRSADLNIGVTLFEVESAQDNCFQSSTTCHRNAQCIDHVRGVCCACVPPFYGNGLHCLEPGVPQKLNGRVYGNLNGVSLNDDLMMHTYVVTTDGRTYSAISRVPASLGPAMQTLNSIGGIIGWLFAVPHSRNAKNGYSFTGGVFNRTARVTFQSTDRGEYVVRLYQVFSGHDSHNSIRMETRLEGNLPDIPIGATVTVDDYTENYKRTAPGIIKSFVARTYQVNDISYRYTWDNTITFSECEHEAQMTSSDVMRLTVNRHYVKHSDLDKVVRFTMTSEVTIYADDARKCGQEFCDKNARCVSTEDVYQPRCECSVGYHGDGIHCTAIESSCHEADICSENAQCVFDKRLGRYYCECLDEFSGDGLQCERSAIGCGDCDVNAKCVPDVSRNMFTCQCNPGYTGDGRRCSLIDTCAHCSHNAMCIFNDQTSEYTCVCTRGFKGDGRTCEVQDCREVPDLCDPAGGICWFDSSRDISICRCNYGYRGDGITCQKTGCHSSNDCGANARCVMDGSRFECQCNEGFVGDGHVCRTEQQQQRQPQQYHTVPCNQVNNCDQNAECVYDHETLTYTCQCTRGFEGDGLVCTRKEIIDCRRSSRMCSRDAECVQGAEEAFVCVCRPGFRGDGASCSPVIHEGNYLIYAQGNKLFRISSENRANDYGQQLIYTAGMLAVSVDTDCQERDIYWTDAAMGIIRRAKLNGSDSEVIISGLRSPEGIAIDFVAQNMFFTDSGQDILQVSRLNGSSIKTLVNTDMVNPRAIALDINRGVIYWTDWNRNHPQIERMNMDGSERNVLVSDGLKLPNGLAFDSFSQTLCWGDAGTHSIDCIRSDGAGHRVVHDKAAYPFDITILNNIIYWTDWERRDIPNVNQNGGELNQPLKQAVGGNGRVYGITAVKDQCPRVRNSCMLNNGGCKYLCLPSANGGRSCSCPDGMDPRICEQ